MFDHVFLTFFCQTNHLLGPGGFRLASDGFSVLTISESDKQMFDKQNLYIHIYIYIYILCFLNGLLLHWPIDPLVYSSIKGICTGLFWSIHLWVY